MGSSREKAKEAAVAVQADHHYIVFTKKREVNEILGQKPERAGVIESEVEESCDDRDSFRVTTGLLQAHLNTLLRTSLSDVSRLKRIVSPDSTDLNQLLKALHNLVLLDNDAALSE